MKEVATLSNEPITQVISPYMWILPNHQGKIQTISTIDLKSICKADNSLLGIFKPSIGAALVCAISKQFWINEFQD